MDGDAEITPSNPGQEPDETALDLLDDAVRRARRNSSALRRTLREVRPEDRVAVVQDAAQFILEFTEILRDHRRLFNQIARREADTVRDLQAVMRPRGWFAYVNGAIAALAGTSAVGAILQGHPYLACGLGGVLTMSAYFANTPLPWMRGPREKEPKRP